MSSIIHDRRSFLNAGSKRGRDEDEEGEGKKPKLSEENREVGERKKVIDAPKKQEEIKKVNRVPR